MFRVQGAMPKSASIIRCNKNPRATPYLSGHVLVFMFMNGHHVLFPYVSGHGFLHYEFAPLPLLFGDIRKNPQHTKLLINLICLRN